MQQENNKNTKPSSEDIQAIVKNNKGISLAIDPHEILDYRNLKKVITTKTIARFSAKVIYEIPGKLI